MTKRKIPTEIGERALANPAADLATAVRYCLQLIEQQVPGHSVELRIPPYGAIQCIEGLNHRRGIPPNVVEMQPEIFISLCLGETNWLMQMESGKILASGEKTAELENLFPLRRD